MKKLLLASVAVSGLAFAAAPAHAEINLELGGYFKGYGAFVNQDETTGDEVTGFDIIRDTELHVGGETTLDNGLTVGAHVELSIDATDGDATANESYAYFSGDWGRVNFGYEDGAAYLLQVAAPSADSNIDGIRQYVQPFAATGNLGATLDYDMDDIAGKDDKITYLSPIMSGFQLGLSYTPDSTGAADDLEGVFFDDDTTSGEDGVNTINETYEVAVRYEGEFEGVGIIAGAGYAHGAQENNGAGIDDRTQWNVGLDLDVAAFGVGVAYVEDDQGLDGTAEADVETFVVGVDYTTGAFKVGASYFLQDNGNDTSDQERYAAGVTYEYGPGMTFRGSIQQVDAKGIKGATSTAGTDGTAVLLGTQVNF